MELPECAGSLPGQLLFPGSRAEDERKRTHLQVCILSVRLAGALH